MTEALNVKIKDYIKNMPSLPTSVVKVMEVCNNPRTSPADLNYVISLDPVLVGRMLKLINSAYYGLDHQVTNLVRAIIMTGINTVKNLALSTAIMSSIAVNKIPQGINMEGFWRHSLCVGVAAKMIAKCRGVDVKLLEEYFTAGLLHDIGKIPLNTILSQEYLFTVSVAEGDRTPLYRVEDKRLGLDHCVMGASIVNAWKLDGPVADAIICHHQIPEYKDAYKDVLYSVAAANYFASTREYGSAGDRYPEKIFSGVWEYLQIKPSIFDEIDATVNGEIEKAEVFLKL
ncbi:histidine kinase [Spirochaetia bacterium]|nr:histidine kinase [Spirochaetia bacterium]